MMNKKVIPVVASAMLAFSTNTLSQSNDDHQWGAGFHFGFASGGLSLKYKYSETLTAQGTLGFFGNLKNYGVRGLYTFDDQENYDLYAFGGIGLWQWDGDIFTDSESVVGFGAGAGIEYMFSGAPLAASAEIGLGLVNFDNYNFSSFGIGLGLHYYF